jgi:DNA-binding NarL/FixJ family response regulator
LNFLITTGEIMLRIALGFPGPVLGGRMDEPSAVVVDELALARAGIAAVLRAHGIEVAGETHAARDAAQFVTMDGCSLVVLGAPADLPPADAARRLLALRPRPAIVALVPPAPDHLVGYLVALGVLAVLPRAASVEELGTAIENALKGVQYVAPALHGALAGALSPRPVEASPLLSAREREVLAFLAEGRTNREIASAMAVTLATVKSHLVHVYAKLGARNRNEALGKALELGLLG